MSVGAGVLDFLARGKAAWPELDVAPVALEAHLEGLRALDGRDTADRLAHAGDVYLACACALGHADALTAFDAHLLSQVDRFVARTDPSPQFAAEVRQHLRDRLLVAVPGGAPRIARYSGRGPLGAWVRMAAARASVDLKRAMGDVFMTDRLPDLADDNDPEVQLLKTRYAGEYQAALREAWQGLTVRERNILRLHFVDGKTIDQIGSAYQVHRATAARWILASRQQMLDEMIRILGGRLQLSTAEFHSIANIVGRDLHVSLGPLSTAGQ
ncbi:MAG TPA: transcriptional regulator [Polyangia bacterium]|nr:transcriptional regulator [Polyangia bacterium]